MALAAVLLAGCAPVPSASEESTTSSASPSSSPSTKPTVEAKPSEEPAPKPTYGAVSDEFAAEKAMSAGEYNGVDKDRQLSYFAEQFGGFDGIKYFADDFHRISEDAGDLLPASITPDNTPQEIVAVGTYSLRLPVALTDGTEQQKAAISLLEDKSASPEWTMMYESLNKAHKGLTGGQVAYNKQSPLPEVVEAKDLTSTSSGTPQREITIKVNSGEVVTKTFYFHVVQYRGDSFGWWLPM